jgi:ATP-dependent Lon protease
VPKDGPSAGIALTTSIVSLLTQRKVRHDIAMTGEITLRGRVLAIGGIKEKTVAAYRSKIKNVIIPFDNVPDLEDIDDEVRENLNFIPVEQTEKVFESAVIFPKPAIEFLENAQMTNPEIDLYSDIMLPSAHGKISQKTWNNK